MASWNYQLYSTSDLHEIQLLVGILQENTLLLYHYTHYVKFVCLEPCDLVTLGCTGSGLKQTW